MAPFSIILHEDIEYYILADVFASMEEITKLQLTQNAYYVVNKETNKFIKCCGDLSSIVRTYTQYSGRIHLSGPQTPHDTN